MKKIVICGGHHNSALVVAEALIAKGYQVFWFGHKYSMLGDKNPSAEYLEVTAKKIPFYEIKAGKFQPKYKFWQNLLRIPQGFWQSFQLLRKLKPDLVFSFGGYLALPVAYSGWLRKIPVVTHEQTTVSGTANKLIAQIAQKVFVAFESSLQYYPQKKAVLTGLPIREELLKSKKKLFANKKKTIYITGGKQGSHYINEEVFKILPELLKHFNVIHQTGSSSVYSDIKEAQKLKAENYLAKEYFFEDEIGAVFNSADFVVSRSGAHTVYELLTLQKPAILIPIPWSSHNEQLENAKMLKNLGLAEILTQDNLQKGKLLGTILEFSKKLEQFKLKNKASLPFSPTSLILQELEKIVLFA
jgi:UDP-N-acetylglucosamine--N-acetylmuramyl-(pentapeptide) pyrophosphoryl-undecaprenol N-acetylglucosamine transferase